MTEIATVVDRPGGVELRLHGIVDIAAAAILHAAACNALDGAGDVYVVWDAVDQLDTSALQVLLALGREVMASGRAWHAGPRSPAVAESLRLSGLAEAFPA